MEFVVAAAAWTLDLDSALLPTSGECRKGWPEIAPADAPVAVAGCRFAGGAGRGTGTWSVHVKGFIVKASKGTRRQT